LFFIITVFTIALTKLVYPLELQIIITCKPNKKCALPFLNSTTILPTDLHDSLGISLNYLHSIANLIKTNNILENGWKRLMSKNESLLNYPAYVNYII